MQITFVRWSMKAEDRTPVSVDPTRVDATEHFSPAFTSGYDEAFPAATKIIMRNKQEYVVQGTLEEVVHRLNDCL